MTRHGLSAAPWITCAVVLLAWAWSYVPDTFRVGSIDGRLLLIFVHFPAGSQVAGYQPPISAVPEWDWRTIGLCYGAGLDRWIAWNFLGIPYLWLVLATAVVPARWLPGLVLRRRRDARNLCLSCGYDLRGSAGICPECGAATPLPGKGPGRGEPITWIVGVCIVISTIAAVSWALSYVPGEWRFGSRDGRLLLVSVAGHPGAEYVRRQIPVTQIPNWEWRRLGFCSGYGGGGLDNWRFVGIPFLWIALSAAAPPLLFWCLRARHKPTCPGKAVTRHCSARFKESDRVAS